MHAIALVLCAVVPPLAASWLVTTRMDRGSAKASESESERPASGARPLEILKEGEDTRVVRHALGTCRIPRRPQRVCALGYLDELLSIGVKLAAASCSSDGQFPDYLEDRLEGVVGISQLMGIMQPDFETLITVHPDLIISSNPDPQTYRQLSKIAPVVILTDGEKHGRQRLLDLGELVGRQRQAEVRLAWYDGKLAAARQVLHNKIGDSKVVFFRVFGKQYYIHGHTRGGLLLYDGLGLTPPTLIKASPRGFMLSPEALLDLDADYVFVASERSKGSSRTWQELLDHPAWQRVPAVRSNRVYWLEDRHHWLVLGVLAKSRMIDEVLASLAPESLETIACQSDPVLGPEGW